MNMAQRSALPRLSDCREVLCVPAKLLPEAAGTDTHRSFWPLSRAWACVCLTILGMTAQAQEMKPGTAISVGRLLCETETWSVYSKYPGEPLFPAERCTETASALPCVDFEAPRDFTVKRSLGSLGMILEWKDRASQERQPAWIDLIVLKPSLNKTSRSFISGMEVKNIYTKEPDDVILITKGHCEAR